MSERYLVTGAQLGIIKAGIEDSSLKELAKEHIESIQENQFVGNSIQSITDDVTGVCLHMDKQK